ncbi:MAG TPA: hypothetical protein VMW58_10770 [Anaerolineae bacterium]|nr:hypothetical protein [Anaerolineae bacterium]
MIGLILAEPDEYVGREVTVVGYYRGWDLLGEVGTGPPVTRSDWVIADSTGTIYVAGQHSFDQGLGLDPISVEDTKWLLWLVGGVRVSQRGQPYIEPHQVEIVGGTGPRTATPMPTYPVPSAETRVTAVIGSILAKPDEYVGREVTVVGYYRGWDLLGEVGAGPPVTRSDWVIADSTGAIYVESRGAFDRALGLDPSCADDTGRVVRLFGVVKLGGAGQPYIQPRAVEIAEEVVPIPTPEPSSERVTPTVDAGTATTSGYVVTGGDITPEGLVDAPRTFAYEVEREDASLICVTYTAYPPSPFGGSERSKIRLDLHAGTILIGDYLEARGRYDESTNTLIVAEEGDYITTRPEKP